MSSVIECPRTDDAFSLESAIIYEYGYTLQCIIYMDGNGWFCLLKVRCLL